MIDILVLCTANVCRSVIATALLAHRLDAAAPGASVRSAGILSAGEPPAPVVVSVLASRGLDVSAHRSRRMDSADLVRADLVLTMTREQLRHAVVDTPGAWPRAFTLRELVRRGQLAGPRSASQSLADWLALCGGDRDRSELLGDSPADDVADPIGGPPQAYIATAALLDHLLGQLVDLAWTAADLSLPRLDLAWTAADLSLPR